MEYCFFGAVQRGPFVHSIFYRKMDKKPRGTYIAFIIAFAIEMNGIPFDMMVEWATLPLLILYPVMMVMYIRLAKREEKDMLNEFGDEYKEYMKTTKMFIPFIV